MCFLFAVPKMRLFLLCHEECDPDEPGFWTSLNARGLRNAMFQVAPMLQDLRCTACYTSPMLRCVQTVAPYTALNSLDDTLRCEPALFEYVRSPVADPSQDARIDPHLFWHDNVLHRPEYAHLHKLINTRYSPVRPMTQLQWGETYDDVQQRVRGFVAHLRTVHRATRPTKAVACTGTGAASHYEDDGEREPRVLLVTHRSVINALLGRAEKHPIETGQLEEWTEVTR